MFSLCSCHAIDHSTPGERSAGETAKKDETSQSLENGPAADNSENAQGSVFVYTVQEVDGFKGAICVLGATLFTAMCVAAYIAVTRVWYSARHGCALALAFLPFVIHNVVLDETVAAGFGKVSKSEVEVCALVVAIAAYLILLEFTPMGLGTIWFLCTIVFNAASFCYHTKDGYVSMGVEQMKSRTSFCNHCTGMLYLSVTLAISTIFWFPSMCAYNDIAAGILLSLQAALTQYVLNVIGHHLEKSNKKQFQILTNNYRGGLVLGIKTVSFLVTISIEIVVVLYEGIIQPDQYAPWIANLVITLVLNVFLRCGALDKIQYKYRKIEPPSATECASSEFEFASTYMRFAFPCGLMLGRLLGGSIGPWYFNENVAAMTLAYALSDALEDGLVCVLRKLWFGDGIHEHRDYYAGLDDNDTRKAYRVGDDGVMTPNFQLLHTCWRGVYGGMFVVVIIAAMCFCSLFSLDFVLGLSADPFAPSRHFWWG